VARFKDLPEVDQILVCTPDKDLAQVVSGDKVVSWDRRRDIVLDADGVVAKFGVRPASMPDWLALVGDSADGFPGVPGWGAKSAATVLLRFDHLESIPSDYTLWGLGAARGARLSESLAEHAAEVVLYRQLATLRSDVPLAEDLADLEWRGAHERLRDLCRDLGEEDLPGRIVRWQPG
jgi:5'-3' exonuclease